MSTGAIAQEFTPRTIVELTHSLQSNFPASFVDDIRILPMGNSRLRVATPIRCFGRGHYQFERTRPSARGRPQVPDLRFA